ncbi:MAG: hypothetical protein ACUVS7_07755 [Bryobacteraceae bacterium]
MVTCKTVAALHRRWKVAALAVALALAVFLLWRYGPARRSDARAMLAELPAGEGLTVFVDARPLRRSGILQRLAGEAGTEDEDYKAFVAATGFEYRRDLQAVLLRADNGRRWIVADARIDLAKLRRYFQAHGGRCVSELCSMQGSAVERQISWVRLRSGRLGIAVSPDPLAAAAFGTPSPEPEWRPPDAPLWAFIPARILNAGLGAPAWLEMAVQGLRGAKWLLWSAGASGGRLQVRLEIACPDGAKAREIADRWDGVLASLRGAAAAHGERDSLPALLADGTIQPAGVRVVGEWSFEWGRLEKLLP